MLKWLCLFRASEIEVVGLFWQELDKELRGVRINFILHLCEFGLG